MLGHDRHVAFTLTTRLGLPNWSAGADGPSRVQMNNAFAALDAKAAYDDGAVGGSTLPTSGVVDGRYAATVDGPHRRLYRRAGGAWAQVGGTSWGETTYARADGALPTSGVARQTSHPGLSNPTVVESWDGSSVRGGRQAIGDVNPTLPGALHVGDVASTVDLAARGRVYVRTTADGQRGIVASAHGAGAGPLFTAREPGGSDPWSVDAQGRMRAQAPTAFGTAALATGVPVSIAPGTSDVAALDVYAGAGKSALRAFRAPGDATPIASVRQDAIALGRPGWTGAAIDLTAPTIRLTGAVQVDGGLTLVSGQISSDNLPDDLTLNSLVTGTLRATSTSTLAGVTATSVDSTGPVAGTVVRASRMLKLPIGAPAATADGAGQVRVGDIGQVEVYDGMSWRGAAGIGRRSGRVHAWRDDGFALGSNSPKTITDWSAITAGSIASLSSGLLRLNRAGLWTIRASVFVDAGVSGYVSGKIETTDGSGLFSGVSHLTRVETRQITVGVDGSGSSEMLLTWTGYVSDAMAAKSLRVVAYQRNDTGQATTATAAVLSAEFLAD